MQATAYAELIEALEVINAVIYAYLAEFQRNLDDPYRGLYVAVEDVERALGVGGVGFADASSERCDALEAELWCSPFAAPAERSSVAHRWQRIVARARLDPFEQGALLLCLAPEIDLRYERIYGYLHDDITRKRPSVELVLNVLCRGLPDRLQRRASLGEDGSLVKWGLVERSTLDSQPSSLSTALRVSERGLDLLLGGSGTTGLPSWVRGIGGPTGDTSWVTETAEQAGEAMAAVGDAASVCITGADAFHRESIARAVATREGSALLRIDVPRLVVSGEAPESAARRLRCERLRGDTLLYFDGIDALADPTHSAWAELLREDLLPGGPSLLGASATGAGMAALPVVSVALGPASRRQREQLWRSALGEAHARCPEAADTLAVKLPLSTAELVAAGRSVSALSRVRDIETSDVEQTCRAFASPRTDRLANRVSTRYRWDDLVLPAAQMTALRDLCRQVLLEATVLDAWGFGDKSAADRGVAAMFCGPPGTGKTMAASIVANDLGLDLYRVDASKLVSKYIGETEKNLARLFDETDRATTCLFFDEADAIFAKRSDVKDSHDRYANLETSYLLQRIEDFDGLVILATNFRNNIDAAFLRRLSSVVGFPMPDVEQRRRLWQSMLPPAAPRCPDLDLDFFARTFSIAGGHIHNIVLTAAYLAAADEHALGNVHLARATVREFGKIGHSCSVAEFGPYGSLLEVHDEPSTPRPFVVSPREAS